MLTTIKRTFRLASSLVDNFLEFPEIDVISALQFNSMFFTAVSYGTSSHPSVTIGMTTSLFDWFFSTKKRPKKSYLHGDVSSKIASR